MRAYSPICLCPTEPVWGAPGVSMQGTSKLMASKEPGCKMTCLLQTQPRVPLKGRSPGCVRSGLGAHPVPTCPQPHQSMRKQIGPSTLGQPHSQHNQSPCLTRTQSPQDLFSVLPLPRRLSHPQCSRVTERLSVNFCHIQEKHQMLNSFQISV